MPRIEGKTKGGSLAARFGFWMSRRRFGKVAASLSVHALHKKLVQGMGWMEMSQEKSRLVPFELKILGDIRTAMRVGCPY